MPTAFLLDSYLVLAVRSSCYGERVGNSKTILESASGESSADRFMLLAS